MNKQDLIKIEDIAIRVAGDQMATMYKPNFPQGICSEVQKLREAERAYSEGFNAGAAYYRHLLNCINEEFLDLVEGVRIDSGSAEDTYSVTEMAMKNGIPVITAKRATAGSKTAKQMEAVRNYIATVPFDLTPEEAKEFAEQHTTENEPAEPKKDDSPVGETMESCINATPEQCQDCDSNAACPRSCADIEKNNAPELMKYDGNPIEKVGNLLANLGIKCIHEGGIRGIHKANEHIDYIRFSRSLVAYTVYFEKQDDGFYKAVFSKSNEHGGEVLWRGIIRNNLDQTNLELKINEQLGW
jgi:hypothetical protein